MTKFFTVEQVIEIHDAFLEDHGGLPGIRDKGLLISAVEMPRASMFGEYLHKTIYDKAAAYFFQHRRTDLASKCAALLPVAVLRSDFDFAPANRIFYRCQRGKGRREQHFDRRGLASHATHDRSRQRDATGLVAVHFPVAGDQVIAHGSLSMPRCQKARKDTGVGAA